MTSIAKLKDRARKHEQKEDWKAAIEAYQKVLEAEEGEDGLELELGLFNRIGDLYLRINQTDQAVSYYEQAADKYAEAGFFNNAIALCNKALRHRPGRAQIYLKLSRLCADQGFVTDARRWILEYAEREVKAGRVDAALDGLGDFVESSADAEVREFLAEQLASHGRKDEAAEHYAKAYGERMAAGEAEAAKRAAKRARAIDPDVDLEDAAGAVGAPARGGDPGVGSIGGIEMVEEEAEEDDEEAGGLTGLETRPEPSVASEVEVEGLEGLESAGGAALEDDLLADDAGLDEVAGLEVSHAETGPQVQPEEVEEEAATVGGLETFGELDVGQADEEAGVGPGAEDDEGEPLPLMDEEAEPLPLLSTESFDEEEPEPEEEDELPEDAEPLPTLDFEEPEPEPLAGGPVEAPSGAAGEEPWAAAGEEPLDAMDLGDLDLDFGEPSPAETDAPEEILEVEELPAEIDTAAILERSRELVNRALWSQALQELGLLEAADPGPDVLRQALGVVKEIVRLQGDDIAALQRRVEYASRLGNEAELVPAYLDLGDALARAGSESEARAMYDRVLGLDETNARAREALGMEAEPVQPEPEDDLDVLLGFTDPAPPEAMPPLTEDIVDPEFVSMLSQFKARVTENPGPEDAGAHYDLGLAFKEMGLVDEAIAEFQTALTGGEERLKIYEELGQCFILKSQYTVALKIFNRALQVPHEDPVELLGVYYHLGQCHEALGQREEAREAYARVLAIDPSFQDVPDRMARL